MLPAIKTSITTNNNTTERTNNNNNSDSNKYKLMKIYFKQPAFYLQRIWK